MKKFKVLKPFKDVHTQETYKFDGIVEVTNERFKEIKKNLSKFDDKYIEEVKAKAPEPTEEEGE